MKKTLLTLLLTLCLATLLCACQKAEGDNEVKEEANVVVEDETTEQESEVPDNEEAQDSQVETSEEESAEVSEEANTPEVWLESQNLTEPTVVIWDMDTGTGTIVENDGLYEFGDNNKLLFYYAALPINEFYSTAGINIGEMFTTYMELETDFETGLGVILEEVSGDTMYRQDFKLTRAKESKENNDDALIKWLESATIEEPMVLIWDNDLLVGNWVQSGEEYKLNNSRKVFFCIPAGMDFMEVSENVREGIAPGRLVTDTCMEMSVYDTECKIGGETPDGSTYMQEFMLIIE